MCWRDLIAYNLANFAFKHWPNHDFWRPDGAIHWVSGPDALTRAGFTPV